MRGVVKRALGKLVCNAWIPGSDTYHIILHVNVIYKLTSPR